MTRVELWEKLREEGLVSGDLPAADISPSPWPVRAMLGIAGWLGALFLLGFAAATFAILFRNAAAAIPAGLICCGAALAAFRGSPRSDFVGQFGFAISLAGQGLILFGLGNALGENALAGMFLLMAAVEAALVFALPNYIHRVFTAWMAILCLSVASVKLGLPGLASGVAAGGAACIWLSPVRIVSRSDLWEPVGLGLALGLVQVEGAVLIGDELWREIFRSYTATPLWVARIGPAMVGLVLAYTVWTLLERTGVSPRSRAGALLLAAAAVLAIGGLAAPGVAAAILILVLGFANGNRVLMGLGLLALAAYLSHFYYQLHLTLLVKSLVLAATGSALLAIRWSIARFVPEGSADA